MIAFQTTTNAKANAGINVPQKFSLYQPHLTHLPREIKWDKITRLFTGFYKMMRFFTKLSSHLLAQDSQNWLAIVTVRNSNCRKVMFSQACVKNSVHGGVYTSMHWGRHPCPWSDTQTPLPSACWDTPPRRSLQLTVRILLECILVILCNWIWTH